MTFLQLMSIFLLSKIKYLTKNIIDSKIKIGNGETTKWFARLNVLTHLTCQSLQMCFFISICSILKQVKSRQIQR